MKVYVVVGMAGEYDDIYEWNVRAFSNKETADIYAMMATDESIRILTHNKEINRKSWQLYPTLPLDLSNKKSVQGYLAEGKEREEWVKTNLIGPNKYDLKGQIGADYNVDELELDGDIP
jgi:hypothetical protein